MRRDRRFTRQDHFRAALLIVACIIVAVGLVWGLTELAHHFWL